MYSIPYVLCPVTALLYYLSSTYIHTRATPNSISDAQGLDEISAKRSIFNNTTCRECPYRNTILHGRTAARAHRRLSRTIKT